MKNWKPGITRRNVAYQINLLNLKWYFFMQCKDRKFSDINTPHFIKRLSVWLLYSRHVIYVHYVVNHKSKCVHSLRKRLAFFAIDQVFINAYCNVDITFIKWVSSRHYRTIYNGPLNGPRKCNWLSVFLLLSMQNSNTH